MKMLADIRCGSKTGNTECEQMLSAFQAIAKRKSRIRFVPNNRHFYFHLVSGHQEAKRHREA